jgi:hypothetical protein
MIIDDEEYLEALYNQIQRDKIDSSEKKITVFCLNQDVDSLCSSYMLQVGRRPRAAAIGPACSPAGSWPAMRRAPAAPGGRQRPITRSGAAPGCHRAA